MRVELQNLADDTNISIASIGRKVCMLFFAGLLHTDTWSGHLKCSELQLVQIVPLADCMVAVV